MAGSADAAILRGLREAGGRFTPGEEFGEPGAVAERIGVLNGAGYQIEHHPHLGYRLISSPDRLIADDILSRMPGKGWIRDVLVFQSTASTNDVIAGLARDGAAAGVAAFAEEQTAGRGRLGRRWESRPGLGLWFSLLLRPELPVAQWPRLTLWIAYAVARAIRECAGLEVMLKWPNDLYASGRKLAGILVESSLGENSFATAGVGLNVNHSCFPPPLDARATSVRIETGAAQDRNALAAAILIGIDQSLCLMPSGFHEILEWASETDFLRGRRVRAAMGTTVHEGIAEGLDSEGALLIRADGGEIARVTSGEVTEFSAGAG
jgi:BirA family biotin operon repressor/biotin-[acetyl-CoA-carboxylase] ligase